jgi:hypothetical protein
MAKRRVIDLNAAELDRLAGAAWHGAAESALRSDIPIVGRNGNKIVKIHPDGRVETIGPADSLEEQDNSADPNATRRTA